MADASILWKFLKFDCWIDRCMHCKTLVIFVKVFLAFCRIFQNFFFSHITLIEGHLEKLKMAVEKAYCSKNKFVDIVMEVSFVGFVLIS